MRFPQKHPHSRGEDEMYQAFQPEKIETPPLTWGRLCEFRESSFICRNTPTHVGKTYHPKKPNIRIGKHPHSRGEDTARTVVKRLGLETPPLTWGRHTFLESQCTRYGNTPTHVGKTSVNGFLQVNNKKHPHSRGEDRFQVCVHQPILGNTPTHVGKTQITSYRLPFVRKHPHSRGEDIGTLASDNRGSETPPLTWGRQNV